MQQSIAWSSTDADERPDIGTTPSPLASPRVRTVKLIQHPAFRGAPVASASRLPARGLTAGRTKPMRCSQREQRESPVRQTVPC